MSHPTDRIGPLELAVVIPTFRERANIEPMLELLESALTKIRYEVIFVDDDSPDGTAERVRELAQADPRIRLLRRIGRRGLSSACLEGMLATTAPYIAVIDADMQHDGRILPLMLQKLIDEKLDIVIGTRNAPGGSMGEFSPARVRLSQFGRRLSNWVTKTELSDPMSGFFVLDQRWLETTVHLTSAVGFKVLIDLIASSPRPVRVGEVPYTFGARRFGESKLDVLVVLEYLHLLLDKLIGRIIPIRFLLFSMVGAVGVAVALGLFFVLHELLAIAYEPAFFTMLFTVMSLNFFFNNITTYRDRRLKGAAAWWGWLSFMFACSAGAYLNFLVVQQTRSLGIRWYLGVALGLCVGAVWNYGVTSIMTWRHGHWASARRTDRMLSREPQC